MKLVIRIGGRLATATLLDEAPARDFASLLPLELVMHDLFGREKAATLPRSIARGGRRRFSYSVGDIAYWGPGPDLAIYYREDGERIPAPGIVLLGRLDSGIERLDVPGKARVSMRAAPAGK